jgi:hypothetical protein
MSNISFNKKLLNLLPMAFILHNIEELFTMKNFAPYFEKSSLEYTPFAIAIVVLSALVIGSMRLSESLKNGKYFFHVHAALCATLFLNAFIPHIVGAIYFKAMTPGLFTAVLLNLPLSIYCFIKEIKPNLKQQKVAFSLIMGPLSIAGITLLLLLASNYACALIFNYKFSV